MTEPCTPVPNRTENHARDLARHTIEQGTASPVLLQLAAACRTLRHRGVAADEVGVLLGLAGKGVDGNALLAVRDFAYDIGNPEPETTPDAGTVEAMPAIDIDDLFGGSPVVADMVRWVAGEIVCGPDLPALTILALASAACAVKVVGDSAGWVSAPHLYLAAEVASGENKSRVRRMCKAKMLADYAAGPVADWHTILGKKMGAAHVDLKADRQVQVELLAKLKREHASPIVTMEVSAAIDEIDRELKAKPVPVPDCWQPGKITPAQFIREMEVGGFVACFPDEGKETLWTFVGENGKGDLATLLCGFTGEEYKSSNIGATERGDQRRFRYYHSTVWLPLQLGVLTPATPEDARLLAMLADRGFLARFLIARPRAVTSAEAPGVREAHTRRWAGVDVQTTVVGPYVSLIGAILNTHGQVSEPGDGPTERQAEEARVGLPHPLVPCRPWVFKYTDEATAELQHRYQVRTRDSAKKGGVYDTPMVDNFVNRIADHAHRLATLLAILRHGGFEGGGTVELQDVQRAIRFLDGYSLPHTLAVYARATFAPVTDDADTILRIVRAHGELTKRDLLAKLPQGGRAWDKGKGTDRLTRLDVALESLESRGRIHLHAVRKGSLLIRYVGQAEVGLTTRTTVAA